jgi:DNA-directed RNA polymerase subunit RPC12/RpoP
MAVSLKSIKMNILSPTLEIIGGDIMRIECPYCGSNDYECFDTCGGYGEDIQELYSCFNCDKQFSITYTVGCIEKES